MFDNWDDDKLDKLEEREEIKDERDYLVEKAQSQRDFINQGIARGTVDQKVLSVVRDLFTCGKDVDALAVLANECGFVPNARVSVDIQVAPGQQYVHRAGVSASPDNVDFVVLNKNRHRIRLRAFVDHLR